MSTTHNSEFVIQDVAGCGPFQAVHVFVLFLTRIPTVFTMMFMMFGNYNPGWTCLYYNTTLTNTHVATEHEHNSTFDSNIHGVTPLADSNVTLTTFSDSDEQSCLVFDSKSCHHVEFSTASKTIVGEWSLVCSRTWMSSVIISVQMFGVLVGSFVIGYVADAFGRKTTLYGGLGALVVLNVLSIFSISWEMYATMRFLLGFVMASNLTLHNIYQVEFVTKRWRGPVTAIPEWMTSSMLFSVTCLYLKDWRQIHIVTAVMAAIGFLPVVWAPESLRWLEVKNKISKFERAANKITKMNRKTLTSFSNPDKTLSPDKGYVEHVKTYNILHLFRKGFRKYTFLLILPWFSVSLISYTITFGVISMYGNFYINLIIMSAITLPFSLLAIPLPNLLGRKRSSQICCLITAVCLISAACFDSLAVDSWKSTAVMVCVFGVKGCTIGLWLVLMLQTLEIYPTVVRGLSTSWGFCTARVGGVVAPFLIPKDSNTFFISYAVMGVLVLICLGCVTNLPETRGKCLQEKFEHSESSNSNIRTHEQDNSVDPLTTRLDAECS